VLQTATSEPHTSEHRGRAASGGAGAAALQASMHATAAAAALQASMHATAAASMHARELGRRAL